MSSTITVTSNKSKRTFTIRCQFVGHTYAKYRTLAMSQTEFEECEFNTSEDWRNFISTQGGSYILVK